MKWFTKCLVVFLSLMTFQNQAFAGTVDNAALSPASLDMVVGTTREMTFSAVNDKPFTLKSYSAKIKYSEGLGVTDLVSSPLPVKAVIYPKRKLIMLEWENIPPGTELKAVFKVSGNIGSYGVTPWRILYLDYSHNRVHGACNTVAVNITANPLYPTINNVITSDRSATVSWTTGEPTTGLLEYGTTTSYGSSATDSNLSTSHSITLNNLVPSSGYHFRITASNVAGSSSVTGDNTFFTTPSNITINLTAPVDGATISRPDVNVSGTITNVTGNETGVTVNGVAAAVFGNQFSVGHIPVQQGQNTITVVATDTAGNTATATATVNAMPGGGYIQLAADAESGVAPYETTLRVSGPFIINASNVTNTGPGPVVFLSSGPTEYGVSMTTEGVYKFTASVTGPDGSIYQDQVALTVQSKAALDTLLKGKWDSMNSALASGNFEAVAGYFSENTRDGYRQQFTALSAYLPQIAAEMGAANMVKVKGDVAEYDLRTVRNGVTYSFQLLFVRDYDGIWRIRNF